MTESTVPLKNRRLAALLAFLVPGLGHAYQGRWGKALLYFVCINGLFFGGLALGEWKILTWRWVSPLRDPEHFCYWYFCQILTGLSAMPALIQGTLQHFDMSPILWGYGADPGLEAYNGLFTRLGKIVEMGYIYTEAAGLLNVLAIFDAYEGPALRDEPSATPAAADPPPTASSATPAEAGA
ncbi:MAG TPA: DUF6677 family protein [Isosphaeraceae bacterium]|jgi:hypothetical protein